MWSRLRKLFDSRRELKGSRENIQIIIRFHHPKPIPVPSQGICAIRQRHVTDSPSIPTHLDGPTSSEEFGVNASDGKVEDHSFRFRFRLPILR